MKLIGEVLFQKYPKLFHNEIYVECPSGWDTLIKECIEEIAEASIQFKDECVKVSYIKEKFGYARISVDYDLPESQILQMEEIVRKYEKISQKTCYICGSETDIKITKHYWEMSTCRKCKGE